MIASAQASRSYVTGAHALKVGFLDTLGTRREDYNNIDSNVRYRFNNGVPNLITQVATPYGFRSNLAAELGVYAQDKWTLDRLTLNLGARFDYLNIVFPEQSLGPGGPRAQSEHHVSGKRLPGLERHFPRLGAVYDLFGSGKTALKVNLGRYVLAQRLTSAYTNLGNPVNAMANLVTRSWNDRGGLGINGDYIPQCDLVNPLANGECGAMSDLRFGQPIPSTVSDPAMLHGWGKRPDQWEFEASVQHQLVPRVGVEVGYFRRWYGNFTVTDNLLVSASDYSPFSFTAPVDPRLPDGGGYLVDWTTTTSTRTKWVRSTISSPWPATTGSRSSTGTVWMSTSTCGCEKGVLLQGGTSTGRTTTDNCDIVAKSRQSQRRGSATSIRHFTPRSSSSGHT